MLDTPQDDQNKDGTDEKPLFLAGDNASSWEHLLKAIYERCPTVTVDMYSSLP
jgi:hypothetical protein